MRSISTPKVVLTHTFLIATCMIVLYPVLWVIKMALSPNQGFSLSTNPLPTQVTLSNFIHIFINNFFEMFQMFSSKCSGI